LETKRLINFMSLSLSSPSEISCIMSQQALTELLVTWSSDVGAWVNSYMCFVFVCHTVCFLFCLSLLLPQSCFCNTALLCCDPLPCGHFFCLDSFQSI
jgi:hypothetical protein